MHIHIIARVHFIIIWSIVILFDSCRFINNNNVEKTCATLCYDNYNLFTNNDRLSYTHTYGELI
jgi:hypothetical protein